MFCQTCGAKLRSTARFCNRCGKPVAERFGTALLHAQKPASARPTTFELKPGQTAEQATDSGPTTPELSPKPPTDQIGPRGTDRQPLAKSTGSEVTAPVERGTDFTGTPPGAITNVSTRLPEQAYGYAAPELTPQQSFGMVAHAVTQVEEETLAEAVPFTTEELQESTGAKPFFTQLPAPALQQPNQQHRRLARAVPLVLLVVLALLILAYFATK